jgi:hypothetical protein
VNIVDWLQILFSTSLELCWHFCESSQHSEPVARCLFSELHLQAVCGKQKALGMITRRYGTSRTPAAGHDTRSIT